MPSFRALRSVAGENGWDDAVDAFGQSRSSVGRGRGRDSAGIGDVGASLAKRRKDDVPGWDADVDPTEAFGSYRRTDGGARGRTRGRPPAIDEEKDKENSARVSPFISGTDMLAIDQERRNGGRAASMAGARPSGLAGKKRFNPPRPIGADSDGPVPPMVRAALAGAPSSEAFGEKDPLIRAKLERLDPKLVDVILREVVDSQTVVWDDIAGLEYVKSTVREIVVEPMLHPQLFKGLRTPPKGMLLFGPRQFQRGWATPLHPH